MEHLAFPLDMTRAESRVLAVLLSEAKDSPLESRALAALAVELKAERLALASEVENALKISLAASLLEEANPQPSTR